MRLWRRRLTPEQSHDVACKWCHHVNQIIAARKAGERSMETEIGLALAHDAHCERARNLAYAEDERAEVRHPAS